MDLENINKIKTSDELETYRKEVNNVIDNRLKFIQLCEIADKASKESFGFIKEAFENISPELFKTKEGKAILNKYAKTIKESKTLKHLHSIYEGIRKTSNTGDKDFFIHQITSKNFNTKHDTLVNETKKVGRILAEGILMIGDVAATLLPESKITLDKAVNYIVEHKSNLTNLSEFSDAVSVIKENLSKNILNTNIFATINLDEYSTSVVEEFNEKYGTLLTEEEKETIKKINKSTDKEELFNSYKNNCLKSLSEARNKYSIDGDNESLQRIDNVIGKVENKSFLSENIVIDICGFIELTKLFE